MEKNTIITNGKKKYETKYYLLKVSVKFFQIILNEFSLFFHFYLHYILLYLIYPFPGCV